MKDNEQQRKLFGRWYSAILEATHIMMHLLEKNRLRRVWSWFGTTCKFMESKALIYKKYIYIYMSINIDLYLNINMYITTKCDPSAYSVHIFGDGHLSLKATQRISKVIKVHSHQIWSNMPPLRQNNIEDTYKQGLLPVKPNVQCPVVVILTAHTQNTFTLNVLSLELQ